MLRSVFFRASPEQTDSRGVSLNCAVLQQENFQTVESTVKNSALFSQYYKSHTVNWGYAFPVVSPFAAKKEFFFSRLP